MPPKPEHKFVNPLLRPSTETAIHLSTDEPTEDTTLASIQAHTDTSTSTLLDDLPSSHVTRRKRGSLAFEQTHERFTSWIDKRLKAALEKMVEDEETSKTALLNEAIADLLRKHGRS